MILLFFILQVTLIAAVIIFIIRPLFLSDNPKLDMNNGNYSLHEQHTRLIESLHDLDFDHRTEKITSEDYTTARNNIINEGIDLLRKIDDITKI
tara:strand:+ start:592 stop:873 length:282 start_codon:yes stop_codon:yes gene_type:complete